MEDSVAGETTGNLTLGQDATGGSATPFGLGLVIPPGATATSGSGGDATNRLTPTGSFESLTLEGFARGGDGGAGNFVTGGGDGGAATLSREATNDAGGINIQGHARLGHATAGVGGRSDSVSGVGGDAAVDIRAETFGDGHAIVIGQEPERRIRQGAIAGHGGGFEDRYSPATTTSGRGGNAESRSEAVAHGDSEVSVYDYAVAGSAGGPRFGAPLSGFSGAGGDAVSSASAVGGGVSGTFARAEAKGGGSGFSPDSGADAGDADATAYAAGLGEAQALAIATGGQSGAAGSLTGSARASAEVAGAMGVAIADASTGGGSSIPAAFRVMIRRETDSRTRVEAIATYGAAFPRGAGGNKGTAFITGKPLAADVGYAVRKHAGLGALVSGNRSAAVEALGRWSAKASGRGPTTQLVELDITLAPPETPSELALAIFEMGASAGGFDSLAFRLEVLGEQMGDEIVFGDLASAKEYFSAVILLGDAFLEPGWSRDVPAVRAIFEVTMSGRQDIAFGLAAVVVPEPSSAVLIGLGLCFIASRRSDSRD